MTAVAAADPETPGSRRPASADEIIDAVGADNRMVAYPYTKLMTSIMDVDMAAAVLVASRASGRRAGRPAERRVYLRGWGYAEDPDYVAERPEPVAVAGHGGGQPRRGPRCAGVAVDDVAHLDLYSCFASSISFARDALGHRRRPRHRGGPSP